MKFTVARFLSKIRSCGICGEEKPVVGFARIHSFALSILITSLRNS
jgi:hypothetical protein